MLRSLFEWLKKSQINETGIEERPHIHLCRNKRIPFFERKKFKRQEIKSKE